MKTINRLAKCFAATILFCFVNILVVSVQADSVDVTITGSVEFNQINDGFLGTVNAGDRATLTFNIDSDNFLNGTNFSTRGYEIDQSSFVLDFEGSSIGLQSPFPGGETPYFVIRNDDPAVDGFFVSTSVDFPIGMPLDQTGIFTQFMNNFSVTYTGFTIDSLSVLDAQGTYDFTGLTVFNWTVDDGPFQPMGLVFEQMTIKATGVPEPGCVVVLACLGAMTICRRKKR